MIYKQLQRLSFWFLITIGLIVQTSTVAAQTTTAKPSCPTVLGAPKEPADQPSSKPMVGVSTSDSRLHKLNQSNPGLQIISLKYVANSKSRYVAYAGLSTPIYEGSEIADLAKALASTPGANAHTVYLATDGFSTQRRRALEASLQIQWSQIDKAPELRVFDGPEVPAALFTSGATIEHISKPQEVFAGEHNGWFSVFVDFTVNTGKALTRGTLTIFARTAQLAEEFFQLLSAKLSASSSGRAESVALIVSNARKELKRRHPGLRDHDLAAEYRDQFGKNYLVLIARHPVESCG